jgi:hypothetical protein|tara:strand:- start:529 stop:990 length:462 start_codon:yes stop_codon:yes gene_type:complete
MITKSQIHEAQKKWGDGIVKIGTLKDNESECLEFTKSFLNSLYDFENNDVLFKPTKAAEEQFRPNFQMALSYFLGGSNSFCSEDEGFAMKPWVDVKFANSGFIIENERAIAMGNYFFTDSSGAVVKVEYTFGYKLSNGHLLIDLHHSSLPFSL